MGLEEILTLVTFVVSFVLGMISKKSKFVKDELIPIQNIAVGIIIAIIEFIITKDFSNAIAISGIAAGGAYDILHNIEKMRK